MINGYNSCVPKKYTLSTCRNIIFQVTDDCCLNCTYCYQTNKGHKLMSQQTIKQAIDLLFEMYNQNDPKVIVNQQTQSLILNFIGGEPLMNIETINYGTEYFINKCIELDHPWLTNFEIHISTNGLLYFTKEVQDYLNKFYMFIQLNITIDGPEEVHNICRIDKNGNGSFEQVFRAFKDWQNRGHEVSAKVTVAPENLPQLNKIIKFFIDNNCFNIWVNPIEEQVWTETDGQLYYQQLKLIADQLLSEFIDKNISCGLFDPYLGYPMLSSEIENVCCGNGEMLAFDPDGSVFPCLRFMNSSLNNVQPPLIIGNTHKIFNSHVLKTITRRSCSTDECFECHVASGCNHCPAYDYQLHGTFNKRSTNICWMHRARALANVYYWNRYYIIKGIDKWHALNLSRSIAKKIISNEEYDMLLAQSLCSRRR